MELTQEQLEEIATLNKKNTDLYKEIGYLQEEIVRISGDLVTEKNQKISLENNLQKYMQDTSIDIKYKEEENKSLKEKIDQYEIEIQKLNKNINDLKTSFSWKITEPLRKIRWMLKKNSVG